MNPNHQTPPAEGPPVPVRAWYASFAVCTPAEAVIAAVSQAAAVYTRAGQLVIDLHPTARRADAILGARRHLIAAVPNPAHARRLRADTGLSLGGSSAIQVWISDQPALRLAATRRRAGMILAASGDPTDHAAGPIAWAASTRRALRPGGRLVVVCPATDTERPHELIDAGARVGLTYTERVIQFASMPASTGAQAVAAGDAESPSGVAGELYVFTAQQGPIR